MLKTLIVALALTASLTEAALAIDEACGVRNPTTEGGLRELADKVANDLVKDPTRGAPRGKSWIERYKEATKGPVPRILAYISKYKHTGLDHRRSYKEGDTLAEAFETQFFSAMRRHGFDVVNGYLLSAKDMHGLGPRLIIHLHCGREADESFRPLRLGARVTFTGNGLVNRSSRDHLWAGEAVVEIKSAPAPEPAMAPKKGKRLHLGLGYGFNQADKNVYLAHVSYAVFRRFEPGLLVGAGERRSLTESAPPELEGMNLRASSALFALGLNVPLFHWLYVGTAFGAQRVTVTSETAQLDRLGRSTKSAAERDVFSFNHVQGGLGLRLHLGPLFSQLEVAFLSHTPFRKSASSQLVQFVSDTYTPDRVMGSLSGGLAL